MRLRELKKKIKQIEDYLGPLVNYTTDEWPEYQPDRWLMEYWYSLKKDYYIRLKLHKRFSWLIEGFGKKN